MFTSLKSKLINVGINVGILNSGDCTTSEHELNAGCDILKHFQKQWAELHEINESNAKTSAELAEKISYVHGRISRDHENLVKINNVLIGPKNFNKIVEHSLKQIINLHESFKMIEKALINFEDIVEMVELQEKRMEHNFQLALYKEKKLVNLESFRTNLAEKHSKHIMDHELKQKKILLERQLVFQEAFSGDLETYKTLGTIPKIETPKHQPPVSLDEIDLDYDERELDQFLEEPT